MDYATIGGEVAQADRGAPDAGATAAVARDKREAPPPPFPEFGAALIYQLARTFWAFKQAYAAELGISAVELAILSYLNSNDGATQQELTARLRVDPSMITRTVKEMEREGGWITRARDERDNRLVRVSLTVAGRRRADGLPEHAATIERHLTRALSDAEREQLGQLLERVERSVRQERRDSGDD